jgi:hypothetical protein
VAYSDATAVNAWNKDTFTIQSGKQIGKFAS